MSDHKLTEEEKRREYRRAMSALYVDATWLVRMRREGLDRADDWAALERSADAAIEAHKAWLGCE